MKNTTTIQLNLLVQNNVHIAITRHCLKSLMCKGNLNAMELLNNINHTISIEDLSQEVLLAFVENPNEWEFDELTSKVVFLNDDFIKLVFGAVSKHLYQFQTKHYKHQYIEIDGDIVDATKVSALADYVCIDNILTNNNFKEFLPLLTDFEKQWLMLRLDGLSNASIERRLKDASRQNIRTCEKHVRNKWNEYNK